MQSKKSNTSLVSYELEVTEYIIATTIRITAAILHNLSTCFSNKIVNIIVNKLVKVNRNVIIAKNIW